MAIYELMFPYELPKLLPFPTEKTVVDVIRENNKEFSFYYGGRPWVILTVNCDNEPRPLLAYGLKWRKKEHDGFFS